MIFLLPWKWPKMVPKFPTVTKIKNIFSVELSIFNKIFVPSYKTIKALTLTDLLRYSSFNCNFLETVFFYCPNFLPAFLLALIDSLTVLLYLSSSFLFLHLTFFLLSVTHLILRHQVRCVLLKYVV